MLLLESPRVEQVNLPIRGLPGALAGTRIVQLSDLHYDGIRLSTKFLNHAINLSNEAQPDLVLITGDFITNAVEPITKLANYLEGLNSKYGVFGCLGNHDSLPPTKTPQVIAALEKKGIKILHNEVIYPLGNELAIAGLADFWTKDFNPDQVLEQIPENVPRIVLSHNPDTAKVLQKWRVDLQLSGHTHGGQIVIPNYGPLVALLPKIRRRVPKAWRNHLPYIKDCAKVTKNWQWAEGWHQVGRNQLYVNRGLGSYFPGRFNCPPEVTVITLESPESR